MLIDILDNNDGRIVIKGTKKVLAPLIKEKAFRKSLERFISELNSLLIIFVEANGYELKELEEQNADLNQIFKDHPDYKTFIDKYLSIHQSIESAQYISENPIYLQRKLDSELRELTKMIKDLYPEHKPKHRIVNTRSLFFSIIKKSFLLLFILFGSLFAYLIIVDLLK